MPNDEELKVDENPEIDSGVHSLHVPEPSLSSKQSLEVGIKSKLEITNGFVLVWFPKFF